MSFFDKLPDVSIGITDFDLPELSDFLPDEDSLVDDAADNIIAFVSGVLSGITSHDVTITPEQKRVWEQDTPTIDIVEKCLQGYYDTFFDVAEGWQDLFTDAGDFAEKLWDDHEKVFNDIEKSVDKGFSMFTDDKYEKQWQKAGYTIGRSTAGWLFESLDSPKQLSYKSGQLMAYVVWECIETLLTMGADKAISLFKMARKVSKSLPKGWRKQLTSKKQKRNKRDARGIDDKGRDDKLVEDKGTSDYEKWRKENPNAAFRTDKQNESEELSDLIDDKSSEEKKYEHRAVGKQKDKASIDKKLLPRFNYAVDALERSYKRNLRNAYDELTDFQKKRHVKLKNLKYDMRENALKTYENNKKRAERLGYDFDSPVSVDPQTDPELYSILENMLLIRDDKLKSKSLDIYKKAKDHGEKGYNAIRKKLNEEMFNDTQLRRDLIGKAFHDVPSLEEKYKVLVSRGKYNDLSNDEINKLWDNKEVRNDILEKAYGIKWNADSQNPKSTFEVPEMDDKLHSFNWEHNYRKTDMPFDAMDPENILITSTRVNDPYNEEIRRIERELLMGSVPTDLDTNALIELFVQVNFGKD